MGNDTDNKIIGFLLGKPFWLWLLVFLLIAGLLFGAFSLALHLLGIVPWIGVLVVIITGLIWGTIMYFFHRNDEIDGKGEGSEED